MNGRFLQIGVNFTHQVDEQELSAAFNKAIQWIHYMPNCWIVFTNSDTQRWYDRLSPMLAETDTMLICPVDLSEARGWLPGWIIDWIADTRKESRQADSG